MTQPPGGWQPQYGQPEQGQTQPPQNGQPPQYGQPPQFGQAPQYGQPGYGQPAYSQQPQQPGQPYGQPAYGQPQYGVPYGQSPGYPPPGRTVRKAGYWQGALGVIAGVLAIVGSVSVWAKLSIGSLGEYTVKGNATDKDGNITLVIGVLLIVIAALFFYRAWLWTSIVTVVLAAAIVLVAIIDIADVQDTKNDIGSGGALGGVTVSVGWGLWLVLVAGIIGLVAAVGSFLTGKRQA